MINFLDFFLLTLSLSLKPFALSLIAVIFSPLLLLHLFDNGWWMIFCYAIYYLVWGIYIAFTEIIVETIGSEYGKTVTPSHSSSFIAFFAISSFVCSIPIIAFPLLSVSEDFLCKINYVFGMHISTTYEGGMFVILMFVGALYLLFGYTSSIFPILSKVIKTEYKKSSICGILCSIILFASLYIAFLHLSKDVSYDYRGSFNTQMGKFSIEVHDFEVVQA